MKKVFVFGVFNVLHAGHIQFLNEARALGDYLVVSFPPADLLWKLYGKKAFLADADKKALLQAMSVVDEVVFSLDEDEAVPFRSALVQMKPDILAVTEDDRYKEIKQRLCDEVGTRFVVMEKTQPELGRTSSTEMVGRIKAPAHVPLRVDFAGGWLDVPEYAREGEYIVNCAISPTVSLKEWLYRQGAGLGGSGGWSVLNGWDPVKSELGLGAGWQDPAVIAETGACVWRSGARPVLDFKNTGDFLRGRMAVFDTCIRHDTPSIASLKHDFERIARAGRVARMGVLQQDITILSVAVQMSYQLQLGEGMAPLEPVGDSLACKYCGGGHGGYAVYLYETQEARDAAVESCCHLYPVEPYCRTFGKDEPVAWSEPMLQRLRDHGVIQ